MYSKWSIWPIGGTLTSSINLGQNGPGSNGNEGIFNISLSSRTGASPSDGLVLYPGHLLEGGVLLLSSISLASDNWGRKS